jgi:hypothetical protein
MRATQLAVIVSLVVSSATYATAQQHVHAQGTEKLGSVHLATSCLPAVEEQIDKGLAQLHSFEFGAAIREFDAAVRRDSSCAMAYWGIALSRWSNPMAAGNRSAAQLAPGRQAVLAGLRLAERATPREQLYLAAVEQLYRDYENVAQPARIENYVRAMKDLMLRQPADTEAKIFYALALAASAPATDKTYAKQLEAGRILEPIWAAKPDHPGLAHYIIHSYDVPALAPRAAAAAAKYAGIAPSAAHALHMPSHTFTRVGHWTESIETNRRSMEAATTAGCVAEVLHAADYAAYAHLQLAQDSAARAILAELTALGPTLDVNAVCGAAPGAAGVFALAAVPARYAIERRDWRSASSISLPPNAGRFPWTAAMVYFSRALGATHIGNLADARASVDSLAGIRARLAAAGEAYWAQQTAIQELAARAWLDLASGDTTAALAKMTQAAAVEDSTEKSAVTPGPLAPAHELLGDMLMDLNRPDAALREYKRTLDKEPNRFRALYGGWQAARRASQPDDAAAFARKLRDLTANADAKARAELESIRGMN